MEKHIELLGMELPEDIRKAKAAGDLALARRLIEIRLNSPRTPELLKQRLILEAEVLRRLPRYYIYTKETALQLVQQEIPGFTMQELEQWIETDIADWIYIDGEIHLQDRFFASIKKVYPEIAARANEPVDARSFLDDNMNHMKEHLHTRYHIRLRTTLKLKDEFFKAGKKVRVHLPIPIGCLNMENIHILSSSPAQATVSAPEADAATICFEEVCTENHPFVVEYEYDSVLQYNHPEAERVTGTLNCDLQEKAPAIVFTPYLCALLEEIRGDETNPLKIARAIYDFVTTKVTYAFMREYMTLGIVPEYCATGLKGDCGVQALLFITLCRIAGIPAKWQSGMYVTEDYVGSHDWAMFNILPYGWMFADCSFGGSAYRSGNLDRWNYYFGNLDPFRMASTRDVLAPYDPPKQQYRKDPFDNQSGEAEYEDECLLGDAYDITKELLELRQID